MEVLDWLSEPRAVFIGALGVAMSLTTSAHVLLRPMLPRSAAAWLAVIWLSPFVGRAAELRSLREALARAVAGRNEVVTVGDQAGCGKSSAARR